jgi:general stress protein CsbA
VNKKQLKAMWVGIVLIAFYGVVLVFGGGNISAGTFLHFFVWFMVVSIICGGLIVSFADKREKKEG